MLGAQAKDVLKEFLRSEAGKKVVEELEAEAINVLAGIAGCNLFDDEGRGKAITRQGKAEGLRRAIDLLNELSQENEDADAN